MVSEKELLGRGKTFIQVPLKNLFKNELIQGDSQVFSVKTETFVQLVCQSQIHTLSSQAPGSSHIHFLTVREAKSIFLFDFIVCDNPWLLAVWLIFPLLQLKTSVNSINVFSIAINSCHPWKQNTSTFKNSCKNSFKGLNNFKGLTQTSIDPTFM